MYDIDKVATVRMAIAEGTGFSSTDGLSQEDVVELDRLGYNLFHFAPYDEQRGEPVIRTVACAHDKTYEETFDWFYYEFLGLSRENKVDASGVEFLDIDAQHISIPKSYRFGPENDNWTKHEDHNRFFLKSMQNLFNHRVQALGYLFLNDILHALGIKPNRIGQFMGWREGDQIIIEITPLDEGGYDIVFPNASYILDVLEA